MISYIQKQKQALKKQNVTPLTRQYHLKQPQIKIFPSNL
jgi:hypothetical protein